MSELRPFADNSASITIDKLTIENGTDRIALYGSLDLTRDKQGLTRAQELKTLLEQVVALLGDQADLPDTITPDVPTKTVRNPFE
jgi:hypothetical protein